MINRNCDLYFKLGTVHFLSDSGGGHAKKWFKGAGRGAGKSIGCKGGGVIKRILSIFTLTASVIVGSLTTPSKTLPK